MPNHVRNRDRFFGVLILLSLLAIGYSLFAHTTRAAISACSGSVSPNSLDTNSSGTLLFSITNNDQSNIPIQVLTITAPSNNFTITSATGTYAGGVEINDNGSVATIGFNGWLQPGEIGDYSVDVTTGGSAMTAASFAIQASDTFGGAYTSCSGDTGVAITSPGQATINITNATASITSTTANVSWNTSVSSTGGVDYGTTNQYGGVATDSNLSTSHSVSLTGLSPSTVYHYRVFSTDGSGNTAQLVDNTFTTAPAGVTTTTTVTVTTTTTAASTKIVSDTTSPSVTLAGDFSKPFKEAPEVSGKASDPSGVVKIEYSVDGGANWLPVDGFKAAKSTGFKFTPTLFGDDNYKIKVRATDSLGNVGYSKIYTLVIDRLPPMLGGALFSIGPQILKPNEDGVMFAVAGFDEKVTFSAVGGPTNIDLFADRQKFSLLKNPDNGLWSGTLSFATAGVYDLLAELVDGAGNKTERTLNTVIVLEQGKLSGDGKPIKDALISLYYFDPVLGSYVLWDGASYSQENPQKTDEEGNYKLIVPAGRYYLQIKAKGFQTVKSDIFSLDQSLPINTSFEMVKAGSIALGGLRIPLPRFYQRKAVISIKYPDMEKTPSLTQKLVGQEFPEFNLASGVGEVGSVDLRGKPSVVTVLNLWSPETSEQLKILEKAQSEKGIKVLVIMIQDSLSKVGFFTKRGGYNVPIIADPDGTLVEPLHVQAVPVHFFLDRKGIIQKVKIGVIIEQELVDNLSN